MKLQKCNYKIVIPVVLLNIANLIDLLTTMIALKLPYFVELNPVINSLAKFPPLMIIFKICISLSVSFLLLHLYRVSDRSRFNRAIFTGTLWGVMISCVFLWFVSFHNVILLMTYL